MARILPVSRSEFLYGSAYLWFTLHEVVRSNFLLPAEWEAIIL